MIPGSTAALMQSWFEVRAAVQRSIVAMMSPRAIGKIEIARMSSG
jgi:hypothetical protein